MEFTYRNRRLFADVGAPYEKRVTQVWAVEWGTGSH